RATDTELSRQPHTSTTSIDTLALHDALPISQPPADWRTPSAVKPTVGRRAHPRWRRYQDRGRFRRRHRWQPTSATSPILVSPPSDRKSTRLNSSHVAISYAVFCLKKKTLDVQ